MCLVDRERTYMGMAHWTYQCRLFLLHVLGGEALRGYDAAGILFHLKCVWVDHMADKTRRYEGSPH
ncbi:hypothetical protein D3C85_1437290 [compost metagenome]